MPRIRWYGPEYGKGSTGERVSYTRPVAHAVRHKADEIGHMAEFLLDSRPEVRREHGAFSSNIIVRHWPTAGMRSSTGPSIDSQVYLVDPSGKGGAAGIEKRHHILEDAAGSA